MEETSATGRERRKTAAVLTRLRSVPIPGPAAIHRLAVNPALELLSAPTSGNTAPGTQAEIPANGNTEVVIAWRSPHDGRILTETALPSDLLALKLVLEERSPEDAAEDAGVPVGVIDHALRRAVARGILLAPASRLRRPASFHPTPAAGEEYLTARSFTLQWHITQACDLDCRHCYDRSTRVAVSLADGLAILDQMRAFCRDRFVMGQVSFSGGNPFLHPDFIPFYRAAAERGLATAILGNPTDREQIGELLTIQRPEYVQVSLEGREEHNDRMRGRGHFRRTLDFLDLLRDSGIPAEVMLTLTRENLGEVLPLGEILRERADAFSFTRLAPFGAGADLPLPHPADYRAFLADYLAAREENDILGLKESLFNRLFRDRGQAPFGGCAGYGCGAAFNFLALLPDGEVHACRKFPSILGRIDDIDSLATIYDSPAAAAYREGSAACVGCVLRPVCRGCPAIIAGCGADPRLDRDPFCIAEEAPGNLSPTPPLATIKHALR